jgi:hypothetical protein
MVARVNMCYFFSWILGLLVTHENGPVLCSNHEFSGLKFVLIHIYIFFWIRNKYLVRCERLTIVVSKSSTVPPTIVPFFSGSKRRLSVGSAIFLISHHSTCPSVDTEKNSHPMIFYKIKKIKSGKGEK